MKKVGIVTLHRVLNFGSVLQAYCTCAILRRLGYEPIVIDYMEPRYTIKGAIDSLRRDFFSNRSGLKSWVVFSLKVLSFLFVHRKFSSFVNEKLPISPISYTSMRELLENPPEADIFLTGSDQVWNSEYNGGVDRAHFLDFAPDGQGRIAYAASFGKDKLKVSEVDETRELLRKYSSIGVRESSGVEIIMGLGIEPVQHVLDPTLLLSREEWGKLFAIQRPVKDPYLLVYSVERSIDDLVSNVAREIGDRLGLKVIFLTVAAPLRSMARCDKQCSYSTVQDFLDYFYHADFVVASSFHGTAFSINFNRPFVSVLPPRYGARPRSLLKLVGLDARIVEKEADVSKQWSEIDFSMVNNVLAGERKKSIAFLESSLRNV